MGDGAKAARKADYGWDAGFKLPLAGTFLGCMVVVAAVSRMWPPLIAASVGLCFVATALHATARDLLDAPPPPPVTMPHTLRAMQEATLAVYAELRP